MNNFGTANRSLAHIFTGSSSASCDVDNPSCVTPTYNQLLNFLIPAGLWLLGRSKMWQGGFGLVCVMAIHADDGVVV